MSSLTMSSDAYPERGAYQHWGIGQSSEKNLGLYSGVCVLKKTKVTGALDYTSKTMISAAFERRSEVGTLNSLLLLIAVV